VLERLIGAVVNVDLSKSTAPTPHFGVSCGGKQGGDAERGLHRGLLLLQLHWYVGHRFLATALRWSAPAVPTSLRLLLFIPIAFASSWSSAEAPPVRGWEMWHLVNSVIVDHLHEPMSLNEVPAGGGGGWSSHRAVTTGRSGRSAAPPAAPPPCPSTSCLPAPDSSPSPPMRRHWEAWSGTPYRHGLVVELCEPASLLLPHFSSCSFCVRIRGQDGKVSCGVCLLRKNLNSKNVDFVANVPQPPPTTPPRGQSCHLYN
jgi:hypothetical protein